MEDGYFWHDKYGVCWSENGIKYRRVKTTLTREKRETRDAFSRRIEEAFPNVHERAGWMDFNCNKYIGYRYVVIEEE